MSPPPLRAEGETCSSPIDETTLPTLLREVGGVEVSTDRRGNYFLVPIHPSPMAIPKYYAEHSPKKILDRVYSLLVTAQALRKA